MGVDDRGCGTPAHLGSITGWRKETEMWTRREVLQQTGMVAALAMTTPWWVVCRAHAADVYL